MERLIGVVVVLAALLAVACGGGAATIEQRAERNLRSDNDDVATAAPTLTPTPTATPTPGPRVLVPPAEAAAPVRKANVPPPQVEAAGVAVLDDASGALLYGQNEHGRLAPASLTKIATATVAIETGELDREVDVDVDSRTMRGSTVMGLEPGDRFTLNDLLYGLMLPSGNDAALAIGRAVSGADWAFVRDMNALAKRLDLRETTFVNPHGLGSRDHLTSAYDLAVLSRYAMRNETFRQIAGASTWTAHGSRDIRLGTLNALIGTYAGADGVKTGYTRGAGKTMVASATRGGHRVYVVLLNAPNREADARALLDWAFAAHIFS